MLRSGWTVVGLGVLFLIIQSCGDELGTGRIMTPGANPMEPAQEQEVMPPTPMQTTQAPQAPQRYQTPDGGWPEYEYDDGREYWDGGSPLILEAWHWNQGISNHRGEYGQRFIVSCIPMGSEYAVWGSNPYTDDSPVCTAGAHMGLINRDMGGEVVIEVRPAQRSFDGVTRNGVTGFSWGPYPGSFRVVTE